MGRFNMEVSLLRGSVRGLVDQRAADRAYLDSNLTILAEAINSVRGTVSMIADNEAVVDSWRRAATAFDKEISVLQADIARARSAIARIEDVVLTVHDRLSERGRSVPVPCDVVEVFTGEARRLCDDGM